MMDYGQEESGSSGQNSVSPSPIPPDMPRSVSQQSVRPPVPGAVSYAFPQTLLGQREMRLRNRSHGSFIAPTPEPISALSQRFPPSRAPSDAGSLYNYPSYITRSAAAGHKHG